MDWYYKDGDKKIGPVTNDDMRELVQNGTVTSGTMVWNEISAKWQSYGEASGATGQPQHATQAEPPAQAGESPAQTDPSSDPYSGDEDTGRHSGYPDSNQKLEAYCSQCFNKFPVDVMVKYGDDNICAACKPIFFQKLKEGSNVTGDFHYAGFWIRFVAKFIDGVILGMVGLLMTALAGFSLLGQDSAMLTTAGLASFIMIKVLEIAMGVAYATFFVGKYGATPGKMALSLKVVNPDGSSVGYMKAFGRHFAEMVSAIILGIGYIMAAFDDEKRALHDRICGTRVIRKPA